MQADNVKSPDVVVSLYSLTKYSNNDAKNLRRF